MRAELNFSAVVRSFFLHVPDIREYFYCRWDMAAEIVGDDAPGKAIKD